LSFVVEIIFDFFHYWSHRVLHTNKFLYINIHKKHHRYRHPTSLLTFYQDPLDLIITNSIIHGSISQDETNQYNKNIILKNKLNNIVEPNEDLINTLNDEITKAKATRTEIEKDEFVMSILNLEKEIKKYALYGSIKNTLDHNSNMFIINAKSKTGITFLLNIYHLLYCL
jgi:hypothetical protein